MVGYYHRAEELLERVDRRRSEYSLAGFEAVPVTGRLDTGQAYMFDPHATEQSLASIVEAVRESRLPSLVTAQQNLTVFLVVVHVEQKERASTLLSVLEQRLD